MSDDNTQLTTQPSQELRLAGARLPYHPAFEERFGVDRGTWKVLTDVIFPAAEGPESVIMALSYCKARNLDILKKPVHIVPVWDKKRGKMVDSVWPAISESRITAMRTGEYAGKEETVFGPDKTETLGGVEVTYPEWAMVTVFRFIKGERCAFTGEKVRWKEYYAKAKRDTLAPNDMWKTKTYSQISKCAEASALRTAFPEEVPSEGTAEEMEGQEVTTVHTAENITGPGLMQRLSGAQTGAGFDHATVIEQTAPPKKTRGKAKAAEPELPPHNPDTGEVLNETLKGDDLPADVKGEPHAPPGAVYLLEGDEVDDRGHLRSYKDGVHFSNVNQDGASRLAMYPQHAPEVRPTETAGAQNAEGKPASSGSATPASGASPEVTSASLPAEEVDAEVVDEDEEGDAPPPLHPDVQAYAEAVKGAPDFQTVKSALATLQKTDTWKAMSNDEADEVRFNTWDIMVETGVAAKAEPAADVSAFRLWLEWQEDPEMIEGMLSKLEDHPEFAQKPDTLKENIRGATKKRLERLAPV